MLVMLKILWVSNVISVEITTLEIGESKAALLETQECFPGGYGLASQKIFFALCIFQYFIHACMLADGVLLLYISMFPFDSWGCRDQFGQL